MSVIKMPSSQSGRRPATVELEMITPERATALLANQHKNRKVHQGLKSLLVAAIRSGRWFITHQGVAVDNDGRLVDGQHRLLAVVETGIAVPMFVAYGIDHRAAVAAVDGGRHRTMAQRLEMLGETNASKKAAIARQLAVLSDPACEPTVLLPPTVISESLDAFRSSIEALITIMHGAGGIIPPASTIAVFCIEHAKDEPFGSEMFQRFVIGSDMSTADPFLMLRNYLTSSRSQSGQAAVAQCMGRTVSAFTHWRGGIRLTRLLSSSQNYRTWCGYHKLPVNPALETAFHH